MLVLLSLSSFNNSLHLCSVPLPGEIQVQAQVWNSAGTNDSTVGVLASSHEPVTAGGSDSWQAAVLVYSSDDNSSSSRTDEVTVSVKGLAARSGELHSETNTPLSLL